MKFSIITCTWNSARYLPACIASVLAQTDADIEWIFVDGGSTDGTLEIIHAIDRPVRLLENVRGGISKAMNAGVAVATGDVVAHLHSDDYYMHPGVLALVAQHMQKTCCDWLFGRICKDVEGRLQAESFTAPRFSPAALRRGNFVPHPATFVRREVFERFGGFSEDYRYAMDYELWLRLAPHTRVCQLDEALTAFRVHAGSASTANRVAAKREDLRARLKYSSFWHWPEHLLRHWVRQRRELRLARP